MSKFMLIHIATTNFRSGIAETLFYFSKNRLHYLRSDSIETAQNSNKKTETIKRQGLALN